MRALILTTVMVLAAATGVTMTLGRAMLVSFFIGLTGALLIMYLETRHGREREEEAD